MKPAVAPTSLLLIPDLVKGALQRNVIFFAVFLLLLTAMSSCSSSKNAFNPYKKFSPAELQEDFDLYQNILQERHPSLYWYTSKPEMDVAFGKARGSITDSLTEFEFRKVLNLVNANIQCGHTSVKASEQYLKYIDTLKSRTSFPLFMKVWNDTAVIAYNAYKNDSILVRGTMIESLNGKGVKELLDTFYHYVNADGNNPVAKDQILSTGTWFGSLYTTLYGWKREYEIDYRDSLGNIRQAVLKPVTTKSEATKMTKIATRKNKRNERAQQLTEARSLTIDSTGHTALMELNSFSQKLRLRQFFRHSFAQLEKENVKSLIIDLRTNGGGRVDNSNLLTRYITQKPFKLADSLYAKTRRTNYGRYIKGDFWSRLAMLFMTREKAPGRFHFAYYEKHYFKPRRRNHFDGNVYILSGGNSFSASVLVMSVLKPQQNVTIVGEPSGGAAYGNTAWFIKEVVLPNTKLRFRLPLFRLVIDKTLPKDGSGLLPEVFAGPSIDAIKQGVDYKMKKTKELISLSDQ